jgi:endonuclease III
MTESLPRILDRLEQFHGPQQPLWPTEPYEFLIWWHCGYPASDAVCAKGWDALERTVGIEPAQILDAGVVKLADALRAGGMVPELRAMRLIEIASRVQREFSGDLRNAFTGTLPDVRKTLQKFPGIAGPGADRILLFGGIAPVPAVPSNCPHVLVRLQRGPERENYGAMYRDAQKFIEAETPAAFDARTRAYLLLKCHGQELCKRTNPKCQGCPVKDCCAYFARSPR